MLLARSVNVVVTLRQRCYNILWQRPNVAATLEQRKIERCWHVVSTL